MVLISKLFAISAVGFKNELRHYQRTSVAQRLTLVVFLLLVSLKLKLLYL
jgi:hypothetical protein